jgi:nucleotide-binding universal stress UspA family protein
VLEEPYDFAVKSPVVVGIDGSVGGWDALVWAAAEARATEHPLLVVYVVEWPSLADVWPVPVFDRATILRGVGAELVDEGVRRAREIVPNLAVDTQVEVGAVVSDAMVRAAAGASMLVLGKRRGGRPWWRLGHRRIAVAVARRSSCPVAVVELSPRPGGTLTGWIVVLDDSPRQDSPAVRFACAAARHRGVDIAVVPTADWLLFQNRGAALVVMGAKGSGPFGVRLTAATVRALATATEPTVIVAG